MFKHVVLLSLLVSSKAGAPVNKRKAFFLLYRPLDISKDCAFSQKLRYDVSYGMGISDTTSLVLRSMSEIDYECEIDIVTERDDYYPDIILVIVVRFPNFISVNCQANPKAFILLKTDRRYLLCDLITDVEFFSKYFVTTAKTRFRFKFTSNSSINSDMKANLYEITATSARKKGEMDCIMHNETLCVVNNRSYCFTNGVVCDGIKHCGTVDWFDEKKSECDVPNQFLGFGNVVAVTTLVLFVLITVAHFLLQSLQPSANSYFIFNSNEDNRMCIESLFKTPNDSETDSQNVKSFSSDDVSSNSSMSVDIDGLELTNLKTKIKSSESEKNIKNIADEADDKYLPQSTMKIMSKRIHDRIRSVTGRAISSLQMGSANVHFNRN